MSSHDPDVPTSGHRDTPRSRLPITGYFTEHRRLSGPSPVQNAGDGVQAPRQPLRTRDPLFEDSEEEGEGQVDYEEFPDEAPSPPSRSTSGTAAPPTRDSSPRVLRTPNPFPERPAAGLLAVRELSEPRDSPQSEVDSAMEEPVVTNDLDDAQSRQIALELQAPVSRRPMARSLLMPSGRDYGFQPRDPAETARQAASQLLNTYVIGPAARTPEELAQRTALRERFLTPHVTSLSEYREQLRVQGQRGSVPPMRTYLVVLQPREDSIYGVRLSLRALGGEVSAT
ncbi:unnamed protein product [Phytophthora fragariaefolia]|uniref:Unnamed protein product n=1 Tax=Phytophthora fragariaefolia TaxID=1490495 RepID=A0A9W6XL01_9STRA|nr:unnamed protein product [Phytophthora fragariaefolia]